MSEEKALFLIDGSNFYHALQSSGIAKGHLDYYRLAQKLAQKRRIVQVLFFICPVQPDSSDAKDQQRFFSKLRGSGVTLRLGTLVKRQRTCPACGGIEQYRLEKGVDVMLAIEMVSGAVEDKYDVAYLLALDADYSPAVRYVRERGKKVFLVAPKGSPYGTLGRVCNVTIPIDQAAVTECQAE